MIEAIWAKDKPSTGAVYRLSLCMWYLVLLCWVDIVEHRTSSRRRIWHRRDEFEDVFIFAGIFVQLALGPYFAFISISNSGRLSRSMPKAQLEYFRLKAAILDWEVHNHYWTALRDPDHEHHNEIIRYKWMDKVRWKHYPSDFFGYQIFTKESGEEVQGPLVPKSSNQYRNSNFTLDGNGEPVFEGPTHPLKRILTLPMVLFIFGLVSFPISLVNAIISNTDNIWEILFDISIGFLMMILLGNYLIRRNTDLINADANTNANLEDLEERLRLLCEKYVAIP